MPRDLPIENGSLLINFDHNYYARYIYYLTAKNQQLGILITINDAVDFQENIDLRKIALKDLSNSSRQIRLFLSHDLHLSESKVGDTAYFDPRNKSIIHYKIEQYDGVSSLNRIVRNYEVSVKKQKPNQ